jgi:protein-S-isoprenylcysteine O-methyltransferase Ste14
VAGSTGGNLRARGAALKGNPARTLLVKTLAKRGVVELAILGGLLFGIAGRLDWPAAWLIALLFAGHLVLSGWWLIRHDPELLTERLTTASNVPHWDRLIARGNRILLPVFLATAALDAGRFGWSAMPVVVRAIGTAAVAAAVGVIWWCAAANHYLSARSRIQSERGHTVVRHGPYRFVRHPLYASRIVLITGAALTLGSWMALVPAALNAVLLILRTSLEDRLLTAELAGYREYARHVPERLVPGLW